MGRRKLYSDEFKQTIIDQISDQSKSISQLSREHGIATSLIHKWKDISLGGGYDPNAPVSAELARTRAELQKAKMELANYAIIIADLKKNIAEKERMRQLATLKATSRNLGVLPKDAHS